MGRFPLRPPDFHAGLPPPGADDGREANVVVLVDLREDGIQVHETPLGGDADADDVLHHAPGEQLVGQRADGIRTTPLAIADEEVIFVQDHHVSPLDGDLLGQRAGGESFDVIEVDHLPRFPEPAEIRVGVQR